MRFRVKKMRHAARVADGMPEKKLFYPRGAAARNGVIVSGERRQFPAAVEVVRGVGAEYDDRQSGAEVLTKLTFNLSEKSREIVLHMRVLPFLVLILLSTHAIAERWVTYTARTTTGEARATQIDMDSIERIGTTVTVWERRPVKDPVFVAGLGRRAYDCEQRSFKTLRVILYPKDNSLPPVTHDTSSEPWVKVAPQSMDEVVLRALCTPPDHAPKSDDKRSI